MDTSLAYPVTFTLSDQKRAVLLHDTINTQTHYALYVPWDQVHIGFLYYWQGRWNNGRQQDLVKPSHQLKIQSDQPQKVWPGAEVPVRIQVTDQQDRPVKRARVHLGGVNAQFRRGPNQMGPLVPSRIPREKVRRWRVLLNSQSRRPQRALVLS